MCIRDRAPAVDYIHDHYQSAIPLEDCAALCQMSKYHFIRQFTALTGSSPHAYQTLLRLQKAQELLADSTLNISEVAAVVGYNNPLYFSRKMCIRDRAKGSPCRIKAVYRFFRMLARSSVSSSIGYAIRLWNSPGSASKS